MKYKKGQLLQFVTQERSDETQYPSEVAGNHLLEPLFKKKALIVKVERYTDAGNICAKFEKPSYGELTLGNHEYTFQPSWVKPMNVIRKKV